MRTVDFTGTVSEATMLARDLIPSFMDILALYNERAYDEVDNSLREYAKMEDWREVDDDDERWNSQAISWILNDEIWPAMDNIAPDGYYFGAHPGDGSDYGFWEVESCD